MYGIKSTIRKFPDYSIKHTNKQNPELKKDLQWGGQGFVLNVALNIIIINLFEELGGTFKNYECYRLGTDSQYVTTEN